MTEEQKLEDLPWTYIYKESIYGHHHVIGGPRSHEGIGTVIYSGNHEFTARSIAALGGDASLFAGNCTRGCGYRTMELKPEPLFRKSEES